jgi:hypothetical protein
VIARIVPERVVELLELVVVEQQQANGLLPPPAAARASCSRAWK